MAQQQVFNLFSSDLLPAAVDLILFASLNGDVAIRVDSDQIAGTVKAVGVKGAGGNDSNLLIVFYVQIMPDDLVMQLHRF